jgi:hypothetical protein
VQALARASPWAACRCRLVCKQWRDEIDEDGRTLGWLWRSYSGCSASDLGSPKRSPLSTFRKLFSRNLLFNGLMDSQGDEREGALDWGNGPHVDCWSMRGLCLEVEPALSGVSPHVQRCPGTRLERPGSQPPWSDPDSYRAKRDVLVASKLKVDDLKRELRKRTLATTGEKR